MSTVFHVGTYLQMGDDFDSRNRFIRNPADGNYDGYIVAGESWSVTVKKQGTNNYGLGLRFKMGGYTFTPGHNNVAVPIDPTGISTGVTSE